MPAVLTRHDLPVAELSALLLDGDAFPLDEAVIVVDEPDWPASRARALTGVLGPRLIAERDSALWVHGCLPHPPLTHTAALPRELRGLRLVPTPRVGVREVVISDAEVIELEGLRLTSPARTLLDLAQQPVLAPQVASGARRLAGSPGVTDAAVELLRSLGRVPGKARALRTIGEWSR